MSKLFGKKKFFSAFAVIQQSAWLQPFYSLLLFLVLGLVTFFFYPRTDSDTYIREVVVAAIGSLLTLGGAVLVGLLAFRKELSRRAENRNIRRFSDETWNKRKIKVGEMEIDDVVIVRSCSFRSEWTDGAEIEWGPTSSSPLRENISGNELVKTARDSWLPQIEQRAQRANIPISNDPCVDMTSVEFGATRTEDGVRKTQFRIGTNVDEYYNFLASGANLDKPLQIGGRETTLRKEWGLSPSQITEVGMLPCVAKVGVGVAVVTADNRLLLGARGKTLIAGQPEGGTEVRKAVHFVAEGMIPEDLAPNNRLSPDVTAHRGLNEELAFNEFSAFGAQLYDLRATGFYFDQKRFQPCFSYIAFAEISADELATAVHAAPDAWETDALISMRFHPENHELLALMRGEHPDIFLASNHAQSVLWFACLYQFGFATMRAAMRLPIEKARHRPPTP